MHPFVFSVMLLAQRVDEALGVGRRKSAPDQHLLTALRTRKRRLRFRLRRSLAHLSFAGR